MKKHNLLSMTGTILFLFCSAGCANHVKSIENINEELEQTVLGQKYNFTLSQNPPKNSWFTMHVEKEEQLEVKNYEIKTVLSYSTPYSFWRELYEFPCGLFLLPVSIGAHVLFIGTIGMLPYDIPQSVNDLAFTGLNPALNWESDGRLEEELVVADKKMLNNTLINKRTPLMNTPVFFQTGDYSRTFNTDEFGALTVHFLALNNAETFFPLSRKVSFSLASISDSPQKDVILTREFLSRLQKARTRINAYKANPNGRKLMDTIIELEKMQFDQLAYTLEEAELEKYKDDDSFIKEFNDAVQE